MLAIKLAVCLRARTLNGRPLRPVQHPELNARAIDHAPHQPVQRIDLAHEMPFAEPADCRVAGHLANRLEPMRDKGRSRTHASGSRGRLATGVPASHNNDVEDLCAHAANFSVGARDNRASGAREAHAVHPRLCFGTDALQPRPRRAVIRNRRDMTPRIVVIDVTIFSAVSA